VPGYESSGTGSALVLPEKAVWPDRVGGSLSLPLMAWGSGVFYSQNFH
jgi:hypothetical protein